MTTGSSTDETRQTELAARDRNGITVRLLWSRSVNLVTVTVADAANDEFFELALDDHDRVLPDAA